MHSPPHNVLPGVTPAAPQPATTGLDPKPTGGPAFQALLLELEAKATDLQSSSGGVGDPEQLRGALEQARTTLMDALTLGDQVLEAFRGEQQVAQMETEQARVAPSASTQINQVASSPERSDGPKGSTGDTR